MIFILEENALLENNLVINEPVNFLLRLPEGQIITLLLKSHNTHYVLCPVQKAISHLKTFEFSANHWSGELFLGKGLTYLAGILPTPFMIYITEIMIKKNFLIKGIYLWTDLITRSYNPPVKGWSIVLHEQQLMICQNGILQFSRICHLSLDKELPAILRYLLRLGYIEGSPILLLSTFEEKNLPPNLIHQKTVLPTPLKFQGIKIHIPQLLILERFYKWPKIISRLIYGITICIFIGVLFFNHRNKKNCSIN